MQGAFGGGGGVRTGGEFGFRLRRQVVKGVPGRSGGAGGADEFAQCSDLPAAASDRDVEPVDVSGGCPGRCALAEPSGGGGLDGVPASGLDLLLRDRELVRRLVAAADGLLQVATGGGQLGGGLAGALSRSVGLSAQAFGVVGALDGGGVRR